MSETLRCVCTVSSCSRHHSSSSIVSVGGRQCVQVRPYRAQAGQYLGERRHDQIVMVAARPTATGTAHHTVWGKERYDIKPYGRHHTTPGALRPTYVVRSDVDDVTTVEEAAPTTVVALLDGDDAMDDSTAGSSSVLVSFQWNAPSRPPPPVPPPPPEVSVVPLPVLATFEVDVPEPLLLALQRAASSDTDDTLGEISKSESDRYRKDSRRWGRAVDSSVPGPPGPPSPDGSSRGDRRLVYPPTTLMTPLGGPLPDPSALSMKLQRECILKYHPENNVKPQCPSWDYRGRGPAQMPREELEWPR
uniref:Uncharacterized protein n=1 Tax=Anopheles melas TaxID=34690 RepID=A0A182U7H4_9DIPT